MLCALWLGSLGGVLGTAAPSRADWLLWLPACGLGDLDRPGLRVLYPGPSLPAVVVAGDPLDVRVRLPLALTPPPGRQRRRALAPWRAELRRVGPATAPIPLPVDDVRPLASGGLGYRVRLLTPGALAAGSYDLWLRTPGGSVLVEGSVLVHDADAPPTLAPCRPPDTPTTKPRVCLHVPGRPPQPLAPGPLALVRAASHLWVVGHCAVPPRYLRRTLRAFAARHRLPVRQLAPEAHAGTDGAATADGPPAAVP